MPYTDTSRIAPKLYTRTLSGAFATFPKKLIFPTYLEVQMVLPAGAALVSICLSRNVRSEDAVISWKTYRKTYTLIGNSWEMLNSLKKIEFN